MTEFPKDDIINEIRFAKQRLDPYNYIVRVSVRDVTTL